MLILTFFATPSFFRLNKGLRRLEHLQEQGIISSELYFSAIQNMHIWAGLMLLFQKTESFKSNLDSIDL